MVTVPAFPPPDPSDPDAVGWPMCTAAAYWRQGRYEEAIKEVENAASAAGALGMILRGNELAMAGAMLQMYMQSADAEPASIAISREYPTLEVMEEIVRTEQPDVEQPSKPVLMTLPSGLHGEGARAPRMKRLFPKPEAPLVLDFDGSILKPKPGSDV
jgi:hypothetical protein